MDILTIFIKLFNFFQLLRFSFIFPSFKFPHQFNSLWFIGKHNQTFFVLKLCFRKVTLIFIDFCNKVSNFKIPWINGQTLPAIIQRFIGIVRFVQNKGNLLQSFLIGIIVFDTALEIFGRLHVGTSFRKYRTH